MIIQPKSNVQPITESFLRYKMYKDGKNLVTSTILGLSIFGGLALINPVDIHADKITANSPNDSNVNNQVRKANTGAVNTYNPVTTENESKVENQTSSLTPEANAQVMTESSSISKINSTTSGLDNTSIKNNPTSDVNMGLMSTNLAREGITSQGTKDVTNDLTLNKSGINREWKVVEDLPDGTQKTVFDAVAQLYQNATLDVSTNKVSYSGTYLLVNNGNIDGSKFAGLSKITYSGKNVQEVSIGSGDETSRLFNYDASVPYNGQYLTAKLDDLVNGSRAWQDDGVWLLQKEDGTLEFDLYNMGNNPAQTKVNELYPSHTWHIYYLDKGTQTINYVDDQGNVITKQEITGKVNQSLSVTPNIPGSWQLAKNSSSPINVTIHSENIPINVRVEHRVILVDPMNPVNNGTALPDNPEKTYQGVEINNLNRTVTRRIKITDPSDHVTVQTQTVKFNRSADVDEVTGNVTYNQWKNANETTKFALIEIPTISGYTASRQSVEEVTPSGNDSDSEVDITYTPNEQTIQIVYKDGDKTIKTIPLTGKTKETVNVSFDIPTNYHVTNSPENTYTFKASGNQNVIVKLAHNTDSTNDTHTASRTINITNPDGKVVTTKQTATITRTGTKDLVTNQINWNNWSTASLPAYEVPTIAGYTPSQSNVNAVNITSNTQDSTVDITYTANKQAINIVYKDGDKVLKTVPLTGVTGETVKVPLEVQANYHVITSPSNSFTFHASNNSDILVELAHDTESVSDSHMVTRTINITNPDGKVVTTKQTATINRTGTKDLVINQVIWNNWSTATLPAYQVPRYAGYTPSQANIDAVDVTNDTQNSTIDIIYTGNKQAINVIYKDGNKVLKTVPLSGNTGETVNVSIDIPTNYHAINSPITSYTFKPTDNSDILIELGHNTESVSDSHTVTRTINITNPDGKVVTTKQTATINRTGKI